MKKLLIGLGVGIVLLVVLALVVVFFSINSIVKSGVETVGPKLTKVDMRLASASISPLSGSGSLSVLFIGNPEGFKTPSAIEVGHVEVAVDVASVLSDKIVVKRVYVKDPVITFEGSLGGNNLNKILANVNEVAGGGGGSSKETPAESKPGKRIELDDFQVEGGKINLSLTLMGGKSVTVPLPPIHLQNIGVGGPGVTGPELAKKLMGSLYDDVLPAVTSAASNIGSDVKDLGTKAKEGLKGLFK